MRRSDDHVDLDLARPRAPALAARSRTEAVMPAHALDRVTIAFGLVAIPARLYSTGEPGAGLSFHFVHAACGGRVEQRWYCPKDDVMVERSELARGFDVGAGKRVTFTPAELKALDAVASNTLALEEFVPVAAIDPIYIDRHYYLAPDKGGEHAYGLLHAAMQKSGLVGIATYAARGKQYVVVVRPDGPGLVVHQLRYPDEVRGWDAIDLPARAKPKAAELALAEQVIAHITHDEVELGKYHDEVKERVRALIRDKARGHTIEAPEAKAPAATPVVDLIESLRASLAQGSHAKATHAKAAHAKAAHAKPARAKARSSRRAGPRHAAARHPAPGPRRPR
jgi:DNA end-binding protein Ku